jgi:hypothetical protein
VPAPGCSGFTPLVLATATLSCTSQMQVSGPSFDCADSRLTEHSCSCLTTAVLSVTRPNLSHFVATALPFVQQHRSLQPY